MCRCMKEGQGGVCKGNQRDLRKWRVQTYVHVCISTCVHDPVCVLRTFTCMCVHARVCMSLCVSWAYNSVLIWPYACVFRTKLFACEKHVWVWKKKTLICYPGKFSFGLATLAHSHLVLMASLGLATLIHSHLVLVVSISFATLTHYHLPSWYVSVLVLHDFCNWRIHPLSPIVAQ